MGTGNLRLFTMQFVKTLRERIQKGEITCSVRLWQRPPVKVGGRYPLPPGDIVVTSLLEMALADVSPALARRSGVAAWPTLPDGFVLDHAGLWRADIPPTV